METSLFMSRAPGNDAYPAQLAEIAVLVARSVAGDSAAFEQIIRRHERRVLTLSVRLLGNLEDAQDAAQEVFLRAFKYLHRLDVDRPIEPWLVRMTINVCRDIGRKRGLRQSTFNDSTTLDLARDNQSMDPHSDLADRQRRELLWKALDELPEKERMAIILRDLEGFSTSEAAAILRSSESTVRSQICRARLRIRDAVQRLMGGNQ